MKKLVLLSVAISGMLLLSSNVSIPENQPVNNVTSNPKATTLTNSEVELLTYMREEEKLARDVYTHLYDKYNYFVFNNIAQSEQRHMDILLTLLNNNNIPDPASSEYGKFNNKDLQKLYNQLIAQGDQSLTEALKVGATIEDVDIKDLMAYKAETQNPVILDALESLTCGSRNHMRAFTSQLNASNVSYAPQFIDDEVYTTIVNGTHERCMQSGAGLGYNNSNTKGMGMGKDQKQGKGNRNKSCIYNNGTNRNNTTNNQGTYCKRYPSNN